MAEPTKIDKENFESVINTLKQQHQERANEDKVNTETIVTSVKESAKTQNRSFGQSFSTSGGP